jgi:hypothetical protein
VGLDQHPAFDDGHYRMVPGLFRIGHQHARRVIATLS